LLRKSVRPVDQSLSNAELEERRMAIQRDLVRGNTTAILLLIALVSLALVAALQASKAEGARREATEKLWESYRAQARAARVTGEAGRRAQALEAIAAAAKIRPSQDLRTEAIAALALTDISSNKFLRVESSQLGASFNPDLSIFALRFSDRVELRSVEDGRTLLLRRTPTFPETTKFSPNGKMLAIGYRSGVIEVTGVETTNAIWTGRTWRDALWSFDFSPDSKRVAMMIVPTNIAVIDLATKEQVFSIPVVKPGLIRFSPDGSHLAMSHDDRLTIWSLEGDRPKLGREFKLPRTIFDIAWHREGHEMAVACEDMEVHVFEIESGEEARLTGHTREVVSVRYSPVSDLLISYSWDGTTRFWNSRTGDQLLRTHQGWGAAFSADGKRLAFGRHNLGYGVWNVIEPDALKTFGNPLRTGTWLRWLDFSPDANLVAVTFWGVVQFRRTDNGNLVGEIPGADLKSAMFARGGESLVTADAKGAQEWRLKREGERVEASEVKPALVNDGRGAPTVLSVDRTKAVIGGGYQQKLAIVDLENRETKELGSQPGGGNLSLSPDNNLLAAGTWKGVGTWVWDVKKGTVARKLDRRDATTMFDSTGEWLVTGHSDEYCFWDTRTWSNVWALSRDVPSEATGPMAFGPKGNLLALTLNGWTLDLVDMRRRAPVAQLIAPMANTIGFLTFSQDARYLGATRGSGNVEIWDLAALRARLGELGMEFPGEEARELTERPDTAPHAHGGFTLMIVAAVASALFVGMTGLRRHRRLVDEYSAIEGLVRERNAQLESYRSELAHSQKMRALGTLAAGIAHDFNNLLSVIRMANKLTGKGAVSDADIAANVEVVEQAVSQGKQVVKSMLGYSRAGEANAGPYSVAELVENIVPLLSKQFLAGISLTLELDYAAALVTRARNRLQQALLNLIVNASEAMEHRGKLIITVKSEKNIERNFVLKPAASPSYVRLSVVDSGPGIPAEVLPRIFEPFFTTKNMGAEPGTGLGLSVVYTIAQEEGLGIAVESAPGNGAAFHLFIPVTPKSAEELSLPEDGLQGRPTNPVVPA
jgi:signal transduction histidine kinase